MTEKNEQVTKNEEEKNLYQLDQVAIRMVKEPPLLSEEKMNTPEAAVRLMSELMKDMDREMLCIVNLKTNNQPINMNIIGVGTLNSALVHPREVMKSAILSNAASMLLFHCHPSGTLKPSLEDIRITDKISKVGDLLDIPLLDHIIIGNGQDCFSFKENAILPMTLLDFAEHVEDLDFRKGEKFTLDKAEKDSTKARNSRKSGAREPESIYRSEEAASRDRDRIRSDSVTTEDRKDTASSENSKNINAAALVSDRIPDQEEQDRLIRAMSVAGYTWDHINSTPEMPQFYTSGEYGAALPLQFEHGWQEVRNWLEGVVFDEPEISDYVERMVHPERFERQTVDGAKGTEEKVNPLRFIEEVEEDNSNMIDGVLNNMSMKEKESKGKGSGISTEGEQERKRQHETDTLGKNSGKTEIKAPVKGWTSLKDKLQEKINAASEYKGSEKIAKLDRKKFHDAL